MTEFPSLREFMLLNDCEGRSVWEGRWTCMSPAEWVARYDEAKRSWETYGDEVPFGKTVMTLFPGHGGGAGMLKLLVGFYGGDDRFYHLVDQDTGHSSISDVAHWWTEFAVVETAT